MVDHVSRPSNNCSSLIHSDTYNLHETDRVLSRRLIAHDVRMEEHIKEVHIYLTTFLRQSFIHCLTV